ncbi:hypothetical protein BDW74DRAFT_141476 [Aspergillus multicolor]|uniref:uncharacterized protein n=1 Tax=Aspergillus multicolor TaxID=41759 RepID=UPI003CCD640D
MLYSHTSTTYQARVKCYSRIFASTRSTVNKAIGSICSIHWALESLSSHTSGKEAWDMMAGHVFRIVNVVVSHFSFYRGKERAFIRRVD